MEEPLSWSGVVWLGLVGVEGTLEFFYGFGGEGFMGKKNLINHKGSTVICYITTSVYHKSRLLYQDVIGRSGENH